MIKLIKNSLNNSGFSNRTQFDGEKGGLLSSYTNGQLLNLKLSFIKLLACIAMLGMSHFASASDIAGNWHLDEGLGQFAVDTSGNNQHGRFGTSTSADPDDPLWVSRRFDTAALRFKGGYVEAPNSPALEPPNQITVESWVRSTNPLAYSPRLGIAHIVTKGAYGCSSGSYSLYTGSSGGLFFYVWPTGSRLVFSPDAGRRIWDGKWHHIAGTYDGTLVRLFVDGLEVGAGTPAFGPIQYWPDSPFYNARIYFGAYGDLRTGGTECFTGMRFNGDIDEVRIWKRALSPTEIAVRFRGD
jgi:hypothetical protein